MREELLAAMRRHLVEGQLPCTAAHTVAQLAGATPQAVGDLADETGLRISLCQLGLFGYGPKAEGKSKLMRPAPIVPAPLEEALAGAAEGGRIPCLRCWELAAELGLERLTVAEATETLGIKVIQCQLGCF